jgi:hypothetical protein
MVSDIIDQSQAVALDEPVHLYGEDNTPEAARAALIDALDGLIAELQKDDTYCGMNIDVHRFDGPEGKIACIQLVPVDMVGGNPARRI